MENNNRIEINLGNDAARVTTTAARKPKTYTAT